jgi:hypothetical protein
MFWYWKFETNHWITGAWGKLTKYSKITCRFRLDIGPGTVGITLEFDLIGPIRYKNRFPYQANVVMLVSLSTEFFTVELHLPELWLAIYQDRLGRAGKFVENSTKLTCLEITVYRIKYRTVLWLLELQIRRGRKVQTQVHTVNSKSWNSNCHCSLF